MNQKTVNKSERNIGDIIEYPYHDSKITLQVVKSSRCTGCFFAHTLCDLWVDRDILGPCSSTSRKDNTSVIFKFLK